MACFRAGNWQDASAFLDKAIELRHGGDRTDWLFLAMSRWQRGDKGEAMKWYNRSLARLGKDMPASEELRRFQAEAAALLREGATEIPRGRSAPSLESPKIATPRCASTD